MTTRFAPLLIGILAFPFFSGCYYWRPLEVYTPNSPPEILYSDPAKGAAMQIRISQRNPAFVVAQDLDADDTLQFQWFVSGAIILGPGETIVQQEFLGSKIEIQQAEESWHGRTLTCVVVDSTGSTASISWPIEILEEN
jgi:hypothetical protein